MMRPTMEDWLQSVLAALALPEFGLSTVFVVAFISATLLPLGSEWVVIGLVKLDNSLFWPTIAVATVGNTLGGAVSWWMGYGAERAYEAVTHRKPMELKALQWLQRLGAKACFFAFLPGVGDPLCAVAGWLKLPFWPCMAYSLAGKFLRYVIMTAALLWIFPGEFSVAR
jgi:membrane protein YqaA with SNARE-associated domain